jgi:Flp pilus assembly CpaE family ATPase
MPELLDLSIDFPLFSPLSGPADKRDSSPQQMATKFNVPYLGKIPMDINLLSACENGQCFVESYAQSTAVPYLNAIVDQLVNATVRKASSDQPVSK